MKNTIEYINQGLPGSMSYDEFMALVEHLVAEGKTSGEKQSEFLVNITKVNAHRMKRLNKTTQLAPELKELLKSLGKQTWLVIDEAWCGDGAQNMPLMNTMAQLNPNIDLRIILRDQHLNIMDEHLTNGGRSVPKLVALSEENKLVFQWGPRPAPIQAMVMDYKTKPEPKQAYPEFQIEIQKWYNADKTQTFQNEMMEVLKKALHEQHA
ncbi:MAG: thioredoxin family protein [Flavobacteriales bacterium]|nr:thioredoxin family protein [Flavobacteriales bacterium]